MNEEHNTRLSATVDKLLSGKSEYRTAAQSTQALGNLLKIDKISSSAVVTAYFFILRNCI